MKSGRYSKALWNIYNHNIRRNLNSDYSDNCVYFVSKTKKTPKRQIHNKCNLNLAFHCSEIIRSLLSNVLCTATFDKKIFFLVLHEIIYWQINEHSCLVNLQMGISMKITASLGLPKHSWLRSHSSSYSGLTEHSLWIWMTFCVRYHCVVEHLLPESKQNENTKLLIWATDFIFLYMYPFLYVIFLVWLKHFCSHLGRAIYDPNLCIRILREDIVVLIFTCMFYSEELCNRQVMNSLIALTFKRTPIGYLPHIVFS